MRATQLRLGFRELEKEEKKKARKERKRLTLVFVVMGVFGIIFAVCAYAHDPKEFFTHTIFLQRLFRVGLIFSGIGLMLSMLAMVGPKQEKPSPKLKLRTPVQSQP